MKSFNKTKSFNPIINNIPEVTHRRRNTIESSTLVSTQSKLTFIDLFLEKNPFQLKKIHSNNCNKIIPKNKDTIRSVIFYKIVTKFYTLFTILSHPSLIFLLGWNS